MNSFVVNNNGNIVLKKYELTMVRSVLCTLTHLSIVMVIETSMLSKPWKTWVKKYVLYFGKAILLIWFTTR